MRRAAIAFAALLSAPVWGSPTPCSEVGAAAAAAAQREATFTAEMQAPMDNALRDLRKACYDLVQQANTIAYSELPGIFSQFLATFLRNQVNQVCGEVIERMTRVQQWTNPGLYLPGGVGQIGTAGGLSVPTLPGCPAVQIPINLPGLPNIPPLSCPTVPVISVQATGNATTPVVPSLPPVGPTPAPLGPAPQPAPAAAPSPAPAPAAACPEGAAGLLCRINPWR